MVDNETGQCTQGRLGELEDEPIPVDKECSMCKQRKLLLEFDYSLTAKDRLCFVRLVRMKREKQI
jgi:hypothetical protein